MTHIRSSKHTFAITHTQAHSYFMLKHRQFVRHCYMHTYTDSDACTYTHTHNDADNCLACIEPFNIIPIYFRSIFWNKNKNKMENSSRIVFDIPIYLYDFLSSFATIFHLIYIYWSQCACVGNELSCRVSLFFGIILHLITPYFGVKKQNKYKNSYSMENVCVR